MFRTQTSVKFYYLNGLSPPDIEVILYMEITTQNVPQTLVYHLLKSVCANEQRQSKIDPLIEVPP